MAQTKEVTQEGAAQSSDDLKRVVAQGSMDTDPAEGESVDGGESAGDAVAAGTIAGKFKDEAAFNQGFDELAKKLGLEGLVRGDFENVDAKVAAYNKMQSELGKRAGKGPTKLEVNPADQADGIDVTINSVLAEAKLDGVELAKQWEEHGELTAEQYAAFDKIGLPKTLVNEVIHLRQIAAQHEGQQRLGAVEEAATMLGGKEQLETVLGWAAKNLGEDELADVNARLDDAKRWKGAILELEARYTKAAGASGSRETIQGGGAAGGAGGPFETWDDYEKALDKSMSGKADAATLKRIELTEKLRPDVITSGAM